MSEIVNLPNVSKKIHGFYSEIGNELRQSRRFSLSDNLQRAVNFFVDYHVRRNVNFFEKDDVFYRARINDIEQLEPYGIEKMKAPPIGLAGSGRINPEGIPYLYLADTVETAIAEVRPWRDALVSVAKFQLSADVKIIDFCSDSGVDNNVKDFDGFCREFGSLINSSTIRKLYFSTPVHGNDRFAYLPSQYISEIFKNLGFDGIRYGSVLCPGGINLALFNTCAAYGLEVSQYRVDSVVYSSTKS